MTDEAIRRQKADLLLEYQEAEDYYMIVSDKHMAMGEAIEQFLAWFRLQAGYSVQLTEKHKEAMNYENAMAVIAELRQAKEQVDKLGARKTALGLN